MTYAFIAISLAVFVASVRLLGIVETARATVESARSAGAVLRSTEIDDEEKEKIIQAAGIQMFAAFLKLSFKFSCSIALSVGVVVAGAAAGLYSMAGAVTAASDWTVVTAATVITIALFVRWK
jgi:phage-related tail protein